MKQLIIVNDFYKSAPQLRKVFEQRFANPLESHPHRFVWDFWNVPGKYRLLRTPAYHYFPAKIYNPFHAQLVSWGQKNLGCHDISPPWLSNYVDGCFQNLHSDVPHGPWAFVYSLSSRAPRFRGGETLLLKDNLLNFWTQSNLHQGFELKNWSKKIAPQFNRLIVFDPRVPHAVTRVEGADDPKDGRLVIHGWFVEPRPYVVGGLSPKDIMDQINSLVELINRQISDLQLAHGAVSFRIYVSGSGRVQKLEFLTNTLKTIEQIGSSSLNLEKVIARNLQNLSFKKRKQSSQITVPLIFKVQ